MFLINYDDQLCVYDPNEIKNSHCKSIKALDATVSLDGKVWIINEVEGINCINEHNSVCDQESNDITNH